MNKETRTSKEWDSILAIILVVVGLALACHSTFGEEVVEEERVLASDYLLDQGVFDIPLIFPDQGEPLPPEVISYAKMLHTSCIDTSFAAMTVAEKVSGPEFPSVIFPMFMSIYNMCMEEKQVTSHQWKQYVERKYGIGSF